MASITSWIRIEPRTRDAEMTPGIEARLHDPLWLLSRQWQLAELDGEDGGSAIVVRTRYTSAAVDAIAGPGDTAVAIDPKILVLDDALSAVDTYTEEEILGRLRDVLRQRTSIIVS